MSDWFKDAFDASRADAIRAAIEEARLDIAEGHDGADGLDRVLRDKLFRDKVDERALAWEIYQELRSDHFEYEPDPDPDPDFHIER